MKTWAMPVTRRYAPNKMAATRIDFPGHASTMTPRITASTPDASADFHRCGNRRGGASVVMIKVFHSANRADKPLHATCGKLGGDNTISGSAAQRGLSSLMFSYVNCPMQKVEATVSGGWEIRRGKMWRIAAIFAVTGALAVSGCSSKSEEGAETTARGAVGREGRRDREHRARGHQVVGKAGRRRQHSVRAQRVQGPERQDRRLRRRSDERDRRHARTDRGVPRGGLRQDHPVDPGRHLQRRHVVVHRHQGA